MIPSLLQIPSAVSDSKLHSVLPNNGKGDFTFDRSTGATRINREGFIEEVGYFSSELVQNGNFSELGSEAVTNGDFATDSDWSKGTGWVIMNGYAESDGTNAPLDQVSRLTIGKTYKVVITVTNMTSSALSVRLGTSSSDAVLSITENGTYTAYGVAGATTFRLRSQGFDGRIDNVSVKQVDPNDRWTLGTGWSIGDGVASSDGSQTGNSNLVGETGIATVGKTFKISYTVSNYSAGTAFISMGGYNYLASDIDSNGDFTQILTVTNASSNTKFYVTANSTFVGSVTNISAVEVQGDRPRLSYDITNGVVEDTPHLLLEPSATNSITFSNDLSQSVYTGDGFGNAVYGQVGVNGTNDAWLFTKSGASNSDIYNTAFTGTYTFSFFVKKEANKGVKIYNFGDTAQQSTINIETGAYVTGVNTVTIQEFPNDWLRVAQTLTISNGKYYLYVTDGTSTQIASSIVVQYFQIEQQAFPTTYIPTAGTTITRAAETCNNSKPSVNSTEGVLYAEVAALADDNTYRILSISDGTTNERVYMQYTNASNTVAVVVKDGGVTQANMVYVLSDRTNFSKVAIKWKANDFALWVDGSERATDTSGTVPSGMDTVAFDNTSSTVFYGKVKGLAVYNTKEMTDSEVDILLTKITS